MQHEEDPNFTVTSSIFGGDRHFKFAYKHEITLPGVEKLTRDGPYKNSLQMNSQKWIHYLKEHLDNIGFFEQIREYMSQNGINDLYRTLDKPLYDNYIDMTNDSTLYKDNKPIDPNFLPDEFNAEVTIFAKFCLSTGHVYCRAKEINVITAT